LGEVAREVRKVKRVVCPICDKRVKARGLKAHMEISGCSEVMKLVHEGYPRLDFTEPEEVKRVRKEVKEREMEGYIICSCGSKSFRLYGKTRGERTTFFIGCPKCDRWWEVVGVLEAWLEPLKEGSELWYTE